MSAHRRHSLFVLEGEKWLCVFRADRVSEAATPMILFLQFSHCVCMFSSRYNRVTVMPTKPSPSTMSAHFLQGRTSLGMSEDIEREDKDPGFPNVACK